MAAHKPKPQVDDIVDTSAAGNTGATPQDLIIANALAPSVRKESEKDKIDVKPGNTYGAPAVQRRLIALESELKAFDGLTNIAVDLANATEAHTLVGVVQRVRDSLGRAEQRLVMLNKSLRAFGTKLERAQQNSAAGSAIAKGLASLEQLASDTRAVQRSLSTRRRNKRPPTKT